MADRTADKELVARKGPHVTSIIWKWFGFDKTDTEQTTVMCKVAVYMAKRDFVDHCDFVDPVDGVVLIDPVQLKGRKVYVMLSCTFRYGRQDMDVMGVAFRRDLFVVTRQVYPELQDKEKLIHNKIQQKLLRKLGDNAFPFFFEFPDNLPCSVALQPGPSDVGKKCAVEFEVKAFCGEIQDDKIDKQSSVRLTIRKIQFSPENSKVVPTAETTFEFLMSEKPLHVKLSLPKETFYHGEPLKANVEITNSSSRNIKDISVSVEQVTNVVLYSNDKYVKSVAKEETSDSVPSGTSLKKEYTLYPLLAHNKDRRGLALDGRLKHEDTNLASSSIVKQEVLKEVQGMLVFYKVVVRMIASGMVGSSEVSLEVPFRLMNPKPEPAPPVKESEPEDMVFEDFKRAYLKGIVYGDDDESPTEA
ncbi:S-arrestin isoform X2 [Acanthochromis polyacanthus]|uniref:S-arrestin isoform X2 n=1 Tax=Acanthochromis polyacanthus TaxID=80966 RepID=UPI002234B2A2|nr:S-arrestin isoform X2 [Acanthochromis polyacanthus]